MSMLQKMWNKHVMTMMKRVEDMKVKCIVQEQVYIADLNRFFRFNAEEVITKEEYALSKDLKDAMMKNWIVVVGKHHFAATHNTPQPIPQHIPTHIPSHLQAQNTSMNREEVQQLALALAEEMTQKVVEQLASKLGSIQINNTELKVAQPQFQMPMENEDAPIKTKAVDIEADTIVRMKSQDEEPLLSNINDNEIEEVVLDDDKIKASLKRVKAMQKNKKK